MPEGVPLHRAGHACGFSFSVSELLLAEACRARNMKLFWCSLALENVGLPVCYSTCLTLLLKSFSWLSLVTSPNTCAASSILLYFDRHSFSEELIS